MRSRSRLAVWGIAPLLVLLVEPSTTSWAKASAIANSHAAIEEPITPVLNTVRLDLQLSGVGSQGCRVEIKPAHPGSRFEPFEQAIEDISADGVARVGTIDINASSLNADRDCAFLITIKSPGMEDQTFKRSVRLLPRQADSPVPVRSMTCYLRTIAVAKVAKKDTP